MNGVGNHGLLFPVLPFTSSFLHRRSSLTALGEFAWKVVRSASNPDTASHILLKKRRSDRLRLLGAPTPCLVIAGLRTVFP
jgi:hypothetical protein